MINRFYKCDEFEILINKNYMYIKNYINILKISMTIINIQLKNVNISINGNNLIIFKLDEHDLAIKGNIKGIDFNNE